MDGWSHKSRISAQREQSGDTYTLLLPSLHHLAGIVLVLTIGNGENVLYASLGVKGSVENI